MQHASRYGRRDSSLYEIWLCIVFTKMASTSRSTRDPHLRRHQKYILMKVQRVNRARTSCYKICEKMYNKHMSQLKKFVSLSYKSVARLKLQSRVFIMVSEKIELKAAILLVATHKTWLINEKKREKESES